MNYRLHHPIALICAFVWVGFVCAISFMEAWLKFRAYGVTLPIGLGIGRLVFQALNRVEWALAVAVLADLLWRRVAWPPRGLIVLPVLILFIQSLWLLPALDERALLAIHGHLPGPSHLHLLYVVGEVVKVAALVILGTRLVRVTTVQG
ncbi:MAG: hypothetical protein QY325_02350 [Flavobacteriales bacterium]|nr:MAG: hypothetical protein QY325_02350 [Flavobacteriales bacterium]